MYSRLSEHAGTNNSYSFMIQYTIFFQIKCITARNSILRIYGQIQLSKLPLINFELIQFSTIPGRKLLSCPSQFNLWQQRAVKNNFQEDELSHKHSTLVLVRLFVGAASTIYQEPQNLEN